MKYVSTLGIDLSSYLAIYRQTRFPSVCISIFIFVLHHPALPSVGAKLLRLSASHQPRTNTHSDVKSPPPSQRYCTLASKRRCSYFLSITTTWKHASRTTNCRHGTRLEGMAALPVWRMGNANIPVLCALCSVLCDTRTSPHIPRASQTVECS